MALKRRKRGISVGTIVMLSVIVVTLITGAVIFSRISGDVDDIKLDPKLLAAPLLDVARGIIDTDPANQDPAQPGADPDDPGGVSSGNGFITAAPTTEPTAAPTPPPSKRLSLTAVGQVYAGEEIRRDGQTGSGFNFDAIMAPVSGVISGSDLAIATLRTQLTNDTNAFDGYNAPSALASSLQTTGFNLLNLSTDRIVDHGIQGVYTTRDILSQQGIQTEGGFRNEAERSTLQILEINGLKVGVMSYTNSISATGKKAASDAEIATAVRQYANLQAAAADVAALRQAGADIIIVQAHWGNRTDVKASKDMRDAAEALTMAGADIVLGTNPSAVLEMERKTITDQNGATREVFIAYSLGNFLMDETRDTNAITGVILHLMLEWDDTAKRASYTESWYMPTWIMRYKDAESVSRYRVIPAGVQTIPDNMTESIYVNMKSAYQSLVNRAGETAAQPRQTP